jgi:hypothetical protein
MCCLWALSVGTGPSYQVIDLLEVVDAQLSAYPEVLRVTGQVAGVRGR